MPLGFERLNERISRPNPLVNFIRPLPGATSTTAEDFLARIAAQCYPIMKAKHIAVMALEEFPWNREFVGRNFNAGEVIQLVLRSRSGAWLPFQYVQMTMIHELAHCKEMNHSKAFWAVRNIYADDMRGLWRKGYTGEGLWGKGRSLESGVYMDAGMPNSQDLPEHTCGGIYKRRGRKRKRGRADGQNLSYAERKQRHILKKFGAGGVALGDDEETRVKLEDGKKPKGKPRVAGSNRGRELRAAAALARFEKTKQEEVKQEEEPETDSEDEFEWPSTDDEATSVRQNGKDYVRVCEAEDEQDENVKREQEELLDLRSIPKAPTKNERPKVPKPLVQKNNSRTERQFHDFKHLAAMPNTELHSADVAATASNSEIEQLPAHRVDETSVKAKEEPPGRLPRAISVKAKSGTCAACSMSNEPSASVCVVCSNVLHPSRMPNHWRCQSDACKGGIYVNNGDYGRCQVCGEAKPA